MAASEVARLHGVPYSFVYGTHSYCCLWFAVALFRMSLPQAVHPPAQHGR
jgi:hypothetical protein